MYYREYYKKDVMGAKKEVLIEFFKDLCSTREVECDVSNSDEDGSSSDEDE